MASKFYEIECGRGEPPMVMEVLSYRPGDVVFHDEDYDHEAELAAQELGFEPSVCFIVREAIEWAVKNFPTTRNERRYALSSHMMSHAQKGNAAVVEALIAAGADVGASHGYALEHAVRGRHLDVVKVLLGAGASVATPDELGPQAPLRLAARSGQKEMVELLLDAGARPWGPVSFGNTIFFTVLDGGQEIADIIKEHLGW
jgi:hypothetical protein